MKNVYVIGVFDLFHFGHVELLRRAKELGDRLIVAINGDEMVASYKRRPFLSERDRLEVVKACRYVDEVNGRTIFYPLYEEGNTFKYDINSIREAVEREKPEIVLMASPNNPTGNSLTKDELHEILSFIPKETVIVIDEAYASFANKDTSYIKPLIEEFPNLLIIRTLSKFYGLPGLRLGFAFMGANLSSFLNYSTKYLGYNRITEEIGIAVFKANAYYQNIADLMAQDRETYMKELGQLEGFKVYKSDANFILVKYPIVLKAKLQEALKAKGLIVKFMNEEDINTHMRITLGTQKQNRLVIDTIKEVVLK